MESAAPARRVDDGVIAPWVIRLKILQTLLEGKGWSAVRYYGKPVARLGLCAAHAISVTRPDPRRTGYSPSQSFLGAMSHPGEVKLTPGFTRAKQLEQQCSRRE
jgi:hypothetical protein